MGTRDTEATEEEKQETILVGVHVDWLHQSTRLGAGDGVFIPGLLPISRQPWPSFSLSSLCLHIFAARPG